MPRPTAEIVREYGPYPGAEQVHGVTYDGRNVWFAAGDKLIAFDPSSGETVRSIALAAHAGTAFDGQHLFQLAEDRIQKIDPESGSVLATIPAPGGGSDSGSPGRKGRSGSGSIATGRSIRWTPRPERSSARSNPTASSPASPGSTGSSGTPPWKVARAICDTSIPGPERSWSGSRCHPE